MSYPPTCLRYSARTLRQWRISGSQLLTLLAILALCSLPYLVRTSAKAKNSNKQSGVRQERPEGTRLRESARLSESVSGHASGRGNPTINLSGGRNVLTSYAGPEELRLSLEQNRAEPLSLAAADFDEDGVPDLVIGYSHDGRGIVSLLRGNVDSIYPNSLEAKQRVAMGNFTQAPFISAAQVFDVTVAADFVGAGDFDADGHWDVVVAARGKMSLSLLRGDGHGSLAEAREIDLPGVVTALITGEINRADGLTDVVVAVDGEVGAQVLVFEGPAGALKARPESFPIPAPANALALGQLSSAYTIDLAVAAGSELLLVFGRDRKLSLALQQQESVRPAVIERRLFPHALKSLAIGEFDGIPQSEIAVLVEGGGVQVLSRDAVKRRTRSTGPILAEWVKSDFPSAWPGGERLVAANFSTLVGDDLLLLDSADRRVRILRAGRKKESFVDALLGVKDAQHELQSLAVEGAEPVAVLPMQLDIDALTDLVMLRENGVAPVVVLTAQNANHEAGTAHFEGSNLETLLTNEGSRGHGPAGGLPQTSQTKIDGKPIRPGATPRLKTSAKEPHTIRPLAFACPMSPISVGQTVNGMLATTDCFLDDGSYVDFYTFTGTAGQQVSITLDSVDFDAYVYLVAPDGSLLASDDDSGGGTDSRIPSEGGFISLPANGTYTIYATSFDEEATGLYTLTLTAPGGGQCPATPIAGGQTLNGTLATTDCTLTNAGTRTGAFVDIYNFTGFAGQQAVVTMSSTAFDTYLYLLTPDNVVLAEDDDGGGNTNSRIPPTGTIVLPANGVYTIFATSFAPQATGGYAISLGLTDPPRASTVVTNTNDSGPGSLRQAILNANANRNANQVVDTVSFQIGTGARTISPSSPLPEITDPVVIDGTTQPGFAGTPLIELDGQSTPRGTAGLKITSGSSRVRGLVINRFGAADCNVGLDVNVSPGSGIVLASVGNNIIEGNFIGTDPSGTIARCNSGNGVFMFNSSNNTIGGTTAAARNIISGNRLPGIAIGGEFSSGNLVQGNYVGTNVTGTGDLGNLSNGMIVINGTGHVIGGTVAGARNVVSGNKSPGIALGFSDPAGILVQGNYIGTNAAGNASLPNLGGGIIVGGFFQLNGDPITATDNTVGGTTPAARNVISGNLRFPGDPNPDGGNGIEIINEGSQRNKVQGNYIGLNATGNAALPNAGSGVFITRAPNNFIGGDVRADIQGTTNYIAANGRYGVGVGIRRLNDDNPGQFITGGDSVDIVFNVIGTDPTQTLRLGNGLDGVYVDADSVDIYVNSNVIAFNGRSGVRIPDANGILNDNDNSGRLVNLDLNFIFSNFSRAVDLGFEGLTPNDPGDGDGGANLQQNFPNLASSATLHEGPQKVGKPGNAEAMINVNGTLNSSPTTTYTVHWYFSADSACSASQANSRPLVTGRIPNVNTDGAGNAPFNIPLDFPVGINNGIINCTATDPNGNTSEFSACLPVTGSSAQIQVTLQTNPAGRSFTVDGTTYSTTQNLSWTAGSSHTISTTSLQSGGTGTQYVWSSWSDAGGISHTVAPSSSTTYTANFTTQHFLTMAAGTGGTVSPASGFFNSGQSVNISATANTGYSFSGWTGTGAGSFTGASNAASVTMNGPVTETANFTAVFNPLENRDYFVNQHYRDFLDRDADAGGLNYWSSQLAECGTDANCIRKRRIGVSAAFFVELEFQRTGSFVYRLYKGGLARRPTYQEFNTDRAQIVEGPNLETDKQALTLNHVQRSEFVQKYAGQTTAAAFVDALIASILQSSSLNITNQRTALISKYDTGANMNQSRALALREAIESTAFVDKEYNAAFVLMQYFGYLRRDPDQGGYNFWLGIVNNPSVANYRSMVCAFLTSAEYQVRFSSLVPRSDSECADIN